MLQKNTKQKDLSVSRFWVLCFDCHSHLHFLIYST